MNQQPLVSCIMPTYNRRPFVPQAIQYFLRQEYANKELIIIDDGDETIADLVPQEPGIRYLRREHRLPLGAKRNLAVKEARGALIAHWDDDDWMAPWRLGYQVTALEEAGVDLCGLDQLIFYQPGESGPAEDQAWQYIYPKGNRPWLAGGTLCYTRDFWRCNPFPDIDVGEDTRFVWSKRNKNMLALEDNTFYVALVHRENSSRKRTTGRRWRKYPTAEVHQLMGQDITLYHPRQPAGPANSEISDQAVGPDSAGG